MADGELLTSVFAGTAVPHQPYLVITEGSTFSGLPVFREIVTRGLQSSLPTLIVSVLHPPSDLLPVVYDDQNVTVVDLTSSIPSYTSQGEDPEAISKRVLDAYAQLAPGAQVFIDAPDILAEDHTTAFAVRLIRSLLQAIRSSKPPSRLTLLVPLYSPLLPSLTTPTFSPSLVQLHPLHPALAAHLSRAYLVPIEASPRFWQILETAKHRGVPEQLAYEGTEGVEVVGDWTLAPPSTSSSSLAASALFSGFSSSSPAGASSSHSRGAIVQVLVRKPTGGVKGITRALSGVRPDLRVVDVGDIVEVNPLARPSPAGIQPGIRPAGEGGVGGGPGSVHAELELPFNLTLTDEQRRRRAQVEVPYAHEGEGAAEVLWDDEEEDDEEI